MNSNKITWILYRTLTVNEKLSAPSVVIKYILNASKSHIRQSSTITALN